MRKSFICLLFILHGHLVSAQDTTVAVQINKEYIKSYFADTKDILLAPIKWDKSQWIKPGAMISLAGALIVEDRNIYNLFQRNRSVATDNISKYGLEHWGDGVYSMALTGSFYVYGALGSHQRARKVGLLGIKTFIVTGIVNYAFKNLFHRHRPFQVEEELKSGSINAVTQYEWDGPISKPSYNSFPSGHAMSVFAMATIFATEFKEYKWVPVVAYTIATLTGLSRINDNKHWGSDIFMGAVVGWGMAKLIYNHNNWGIKMTPYSTGNTTGMLMLIQVK